MEKKDGFVLFFAFLSALLAICLGYHMWLLHCEVAELRGRVREVEHLKSKVEQWEEKCDCSRSPTSSGQKDTLLPQKTSTDGKHAVDKRETQEPTDIPTLLTRAFSGIVEGQLRQALKCNEEDQELGRECTIQPGPKGEVGMAGEQGLKGEVGEKGVKGDIGLTGYPGHKGDRGELGPVGPQCEGQKGKKGERGQLGYPGYKGEKGEVGGRGRIGPVGLQGVQGIKGQKGEVALRQSGCTWHYTDRCGHLCGVKRPFTAVCPTGQYVAGFGIHTYTKFGRYNTRVYCCTP